MDAKSLQLLADGHTTKTRPSTLPASAYIGTWKGHGLVREGSIESSGIGLIAAFWLLFWRMALRVFVLLTVLGTTYGFLVGGLFPYGIGLMISGPIFGAIAGLGLGVLEGLVLGVVAVLVHRGGVPGDSLRYRRTAELACVVACILAVALFWGVTFLRGPDLAASVRLAFTRDLPVALILVVGPLLVASGATWVAARKVVGQYAREVAAGSPLEERWDEGPEANHCGPSSYLRTS